MACNGEPICLIDHSVHASISFVLTGLHRESGLPENALAAAMAALGIEGGPDSESALNELVMAMLDNTHVAKAFNSSHQMLLAQKAKEIAHEGLSHGVPF